MFATKEKDKYINTLGEASNDKKVDLLKQIESNKEKISILMKNLQKKLKN